MTLCRSLMNVWRVTVQKREASKALMWMCRFRPPFDMSEAQVGGEGQILINVWGSRAVVFDTASQRRSLRPSCLLRGPYTRMSSGSDEIVQSRQSTDTTKEVRRSALCPWIPCRSDCGSRDWVGYGPISATARRSCNSCYAWRNDKGRDVQ